MICEQLKQIDIRKATKLLGHALPERFTSLGQIYRTTETTCHFGGTRQWFLCPLCDQRCAILYPVHCRKCLGARYAIERKSPESRRISKALKIRAALGQKDGGLIAPFPARPKGMHQKTYERIKGEAEEIEAQIGLDNGKFLERYPPMKIEGLSDPSKLFELF